MAIDKNHPPLPLAPGFQFKSGELVSPEDSQKIVESRVIDESQIYSGPTHPTGGLTAAFASGTVAGAPSIVEMARALKNDPQLIYQFVHDQIEWEPGWGVQKGALGCLLDQMGNSFDQSMLMVALLRQAGYTANYSLGVIRISQAAASAWFGTESTDIWGSLNYCANENIPANYYFDGTNYWLEMSHVWIQCVISGTTYLFDPSYKTYTRKTGLSASSLASALGYVASSFISDAESGATIDSSGNYVANMNRANIRTDLKTFATNLATYIKNNTIGSAPPGTATVDDILGGQTIVPTTIPLLQTTLSYEKPGDTPTIWTADVPTAYKTTLRVQFPDNSGGWCIDQTFTSDQLAGGRLTVFFNGSLQPVLYLNGSVVQTGIAQGAGTYNSIQLTVTHNAYSVTWYNQQWWQSFIWVSGYYLIANAWGNLGRGQLDYHGQQLAVNQAAGGSANSEPILGENLSVLWFNWAAQNSKACDLVNRIMNCHSMYNHQVGMVSFNNGGDNALATDLGGVSGSSTNLNNDTTKTPINDTVLAMHGVALEAAAGQQIAGVTPGVTATSVIDNANRTALVTIAGTVSVGDVLTITIHDAALSGGVKSDSYTVITGDTLTTIAAGLKSAINADTSLSAIGVTATSSGAVIMVTSLSVNQTSYTSSTSGGATETITIAFQNIYKGTSSNWNPGTGFNLSTTLSGNGYAAGDLTNIYNWYISNGDSVVIPGNPTNTLGSWTGFGYFAYPSAGAFGIINGALKGEHNPPGPPKPGPQPPNPGKNPGGQPPSKEPIGMFTGDYFYNREDMTVGSEEFPYKLSFARAYNSQNQYVNGPLGFGWTHNHALTATVGSDGLLAMGAQYALPAAASIAEFFVCTDLISDTNRPVAKLVTVALADQWWVDQITKNTVLAVLSNSTYVFVLMPDGSYAPPPNNAAILTLSGGLYTLATPQGVKTNFNSNGQITTTVYPTGLTVTYTYSSGILSTVSNGLGRTLTLNYTSGQLTSVTDGNGRTVSYGFDANKNLTSFTDATSKIYTYQYDQPGRMTKYFKPANPATAFVTNVYDSLSRVKTQSNARNQQWTYYFAGSRSEEDDPLGNSHIMYFNEFGSVIRDINALGYETDSVYDGLNRITQSTLPEGNMVQWTYDANNNPLTMTLVPKSGSGLSNIVYYYTYDSTWAKIKTFKDGNGNTYTYSYDPSNGNLLSLTKPIVGGQTPIEQWTYNSRGQILTYTDETSIVTKFTYDMSTEKLLSKIVDYSAGGGHLNLTTLYGYNSWGDVNNVTDPNSNQTGFVFDNERRLTQKTDPTPFSYVTNYGYDANGNPNLRQQQTGGIPPYRTYSIVYTVTDKPSTFTDPALKVSTWNYDGKDRLANSIDAANNEYQYSYDQLDRLYQVTDPTNTICETKTYSHNGYLASIKDANNNTTQFTHDGLDRLNQTIFADTTYQQNQSYDGNGNVLTYVTRSAHSIVNTYDSLNRLSTKAPSGEATATYTYDLHNRKLSSSTPVVSGNPATGTFSFYYDTAGRFYKETTPDAKSVVCQLDNNGNITQLTYPDSYYVTRTYDQLNRLTNIYLNGATLPAVQVAYDQLSRRSQMTFGNGVIVGYSFQLNNDLTALSEIFSGSSVMLTYGFNNVHQEISRGVTNNSYFWHPSSATTNSYGTANSVNQYPSVGGTSYGYDGNGNLSTDGTRTMTFDTEDHLVQTVIGSTTVTYVYDADHRQIQKSVGSTKSRYVYSIWQRIADYDGTSDTFQNRYVYGDTMDEALMMVSSSGTITYLHGDRRRSIIATTNSSGIVNNSYSYSPFGESASLVGTTVGFTGQRWDPDSSLYYYKRRYLNPSIGRFLQTDPVGYLSLALNLYTYVENDPLDHSDELGLMATTGQSGLSSLASSGDMFDINPQFTSSGGITTAMFGQPHPNPNNPMTPFFPCPKTDPGEVTCDSCTYCPDTCATCQTCVTECIKCSPAPCSGDVACMEPLTAQDCITKGACSDKC